MPFSLLDGHQDSPAGPFRRYATRYEPARRDACLAWWDGSTTTDFAFEVRETSVHEAQRHYALLLDISHTGASIALDQIPDGEAEVWLRLEGEETTDWTEATIVGMTTTSRGPHMVRLAFRAPCAFETLRAAVCG